MNPFQLSKADMNRWPILLRLYYGGPYLGHGSRYLYWGQLLTASRIRLWQTAALNAGFVLVAGSLFVIAGTPIRGVTYTWWLLGLALFTFATMGLDTIKLVNWLRRSK